MINRVTLAASLLLTMAALPASASAVEGVEAVTSVRLSKQEQLAVPEPSNTIEAPRVAANYTFATTTTGSLTDMSTGTTQLLAGNIDDTASPLTSIGFDFFYQGVRQTQFSINDNGVLRLGASAQASSPYQPLGQANLPIITAYGADQRTHTGDGKVHYRVSGTAPSRVLTVEWLNNQSNFNTGGTADLTYQVQLREGTGVIEFIYGGMTMSTAGSTDVNSNDPHIGFSSSNVIGTVGSVDAPLSGTPAPSFSSGSATAVNNAYATAGPLAVLTSAADGSRRTFSFTPPTPTAPTALNFSGVTPTSMTLNWTDSPDELIYAIYNSTDGTNFNFFATAAQNAITLPTTGLAPNTTYTWRVFAVSEGSLGTALSGSQATSAPGNIASTPTGGNWSNPATWIGGVLPTDGDNVTISAGSTVTIDTAAVALNVTVASNAVLQWETTTARTLTVGADVINDGFLQSQPAGTVTTHNLSIGGNLTNNNTLDFATSTAGAAITFTGSSNTTFGGAGATTDVRAITINKGTSNAATLELSPSNFTVQGANTDVAGFLTLSNGTFKLSGSFTATNRVFTAAAYTIGASTAFWLNNPNFTVAGQNGTGAVAGRLRVSQGTYNIGTAAGNSLGFNAGANVTVEGGAINSTARFGVGASGNAITYLQTGGTITVNTVGNTSTTLASFDLGTNAASSISMSGGTVIAQLASTAASGPRDYRNQAGSGAPGITGGTVQFGNASSGAAKAFNAAGVFPDVVVNTGTGNHSLTMLAPTGFNNLMRNLTVGTGGTFNTGNNVFLFNGDTITNNGTLTSSGANSRFIVFRPATNVAYTGTGTVTAPMNSLELQNDLNFTFDPAVSGVVVNRVIIFGGSFVNANKITLGNAGNATVQIGNTTTPTAGGTFDVAPNFNLGGTGVQNISYLRTANSKTAGVEVNPTRVLNNLTYDDNDPTHTLSIAGGGLTVNGTLALTNGRVVIAAPNAVTLGSTGTTTRTTGYVDGKLAKPLAAAALRTFEVGTANGYSPVVANVTAGTFPLLLESTAVQAVMPNFVPVDKAIARHWLIGAPAGTTADLTFSYLDGDVPGTATEANLRTYNGTPVPPASFTDLGGTLDTGLNTMLVSGVTQFDAFTLAEAGGAAAADLRITKTDGVTSVQTGATTTYTITAANAGALGVNGATVSESPGADLTCGAWSCVGSGGGTCTASGTGTISDVVNLPVGASVTYTQQCTVATVSAAASVDNTASIAVPAGYIDTAPADNSATDSNALTRVVNASITKTDGSTTVNPGATVTYTIVAGNSGPNAATTTVTDNFPASLNGCTWTCSGSGATCGSASGNANISDTGSIPPGGTLTYVAMCTLSPSATGTLSNTATVAVGASESDSDGSNNSATDNSTVVALPDVAVTITDNRRFVRVGESLNYTIVVSNSGSPSTATAAVSDALPAELGGGSWTCTPTGGATCAAGTGNTLTDTATLPANTQVTYVYSATVLAGSLDETITNSVSATSAGDPNTSNNTASDTPEDIIVLFKNGFENAPVTIVPEGAGNANGYIEGALRVDPQLLAGLDATPVTVVTGVTDRGEELFALELARFGDGVVLRSVLRDANGMSERGAWFAVDPTRAPIAFAWQAASGDASDGYLRLSGGGAPQHNGSRGDRGRLAALRPAVVQGVQWVTLAGGN
ncbi:MAG TPA: fibronectin type III domain-containing protein [Tahibacter sp.]|uniref:beta strand repeat-containing protein n=1 Tax=Tahibacter sp. TaxID=2056211 RepID=UPI002CCAC847|nr:fibronectin type III domain-containing protein [Tahibacter sp.]HSX62047.1 fibronectin type III domain-containing protein [Tahibacter sp.]